MALVLAQMPTTESGGFTGFYRDLAHDATRLLTDPVYIVMLLIASGIVALVIRTVVNLGIEDQRPPTVNE
jgi:hypothetical protein